MQMKMDSCDYVQLNVSYTARYLTIVRIRVHFNVEAVCLIDNIREVTKSYPKGDQDIEFLID